MFRNSKRQWLISARCQAQFEKFLSLDAIKIRGIVDFIVSRLFSVGGVVEDTEETDANCRLSRELFWLERFSAYSRFLSNVRFFSFFFLIHVGTLHWEKLRLSIISANGMTEVGHSVWFVFGDERRAARLMT